MNQAPDSDQSMPDSLQGTQSRGREWKRGDLFENCVVIGIENVMIWVEKVENWRPIDCCRVRVA